MSITSEEVDRVAKLARLNLEPAEKQKLQIEMSRILEYVDQLKEVHEKVGSFKDEFVAVNLMRDDIAEQPTDPENFISQAPDREGNFIKVKNILD